MRCAQCGYESGTYGVRMHWYQMHSGKAIVWDEETYQEYGPIGQEL